MKKRVILIALILCLVLAGGLAYCYFRPVDFHSTGESGVILYNGTRYELIFDGPASTVKHGFVRGRTEDGAFLYGVKGADDCILVSSSGHGSLYQRSKGD